MVTKWVGDFGFWDRKGYFEVWHLNISVQSLSRVRLFVTPWAAAHQTSLSITNSQSLLKLISIKSVMPSNHLILCHPLLLLPSIFPDLGLFKWVSSLYQVAKVLAVQLQHQSFQWIFRTYFNVRVAFQLWTKIYDLIWQIFV